MGHVRHRRDVYPLQGVVTIVRQSTAKERKYRIEHMHWTTIFEQDLNNGAFG